MTAMEAVDCRQASATAGRDAPRDHRWPAALVVVAGLTGVLAVPLLVGLAVLRDPLWFPHGDLAQIEMRVRDVLSSHPPLVGLGGRIRGFGTSGSHPGPLGFVALWPVYWAFGADGWALQVASATLNVVAAASAVTIAHRRGSWPFAVAVACVLAFLMRGYGAVVLIQPWNPQQPVLWWIVFLLAVWAVLCDDLAMLPVAVFAGSLCMQIHIPYLGLGLGMAAVIGAGLVVMGVQRRHDPARRRELQRWVAASAVFAVVLWSPPLIDQAIHDPGNLSIIVENFRHPYDQQVPFGDAVEMFFAHLDVGELVTTNRATTGSPIPGVVLLAVWAGAAAVAVWRHEPTLMRLHAVVGAAVLLGLVAMSRIFGPAWNYLMLWAWGTTALLVLATAWTLLSSAAGPDDRSPPGGLRLPPLRRPLPMAAAFGGAALVLTTLFSIDAASTEMPNDHFGDNIRRMTAAVTAALDDDPAGCDDDCRYLVTSDDPVGYGNEEIGLILALEREGVDAAATPSQVPVVRQHRVVDPNDADARIHIAVGEIPISAVRREPGARELTRFGLSPERRATYRQLRRELVDRLEAERLDDLAAQVTTQEIIRVDPGMPDDVQLLVHQVNEFERPHAVFLVLPSQTAPR